MTDKELLAELRELRELLAELRVLRDALLESAPKPFTAPFSPLNEVRRLQAAAGAVGPVRQRLPDMRGGVTRVLRIRGAEQGGEEVSCYATVGTFPSGSPGELFLKVDRQGSTLSGFADAVAIAVFLGLQHGVPLELYATKFRGMRFEPQGATGDPDHPIATSLLDAVGSWLLKQFGGS